MSSEDPQRKQDLDSETLVNTSLVKGSALQWNSPPRLRPMVSERAFRYPAVLISQEHCQSVFADLRARAAPSAVTEGP